MLATSRSPFECSRHVIAGIRLHCRAPAVVSNLTALKRSWRPLLHSRADGSTQEAGVPYPKKHRGRRKQGSRRRRQARKRRHGR